MLKLVLLVAGLSLGAQQSEPEPSGEIAGEELSELLEKWPDQYVRWIMTDAEKKVYESLESDEEKLKFIEFFWARRDRSPETVDNEYRAEYLERFAFVANYLSAGKPGWATDRGRIYLILGPPHARESNPFGRWGGERPSEVWTYNNLDIPDFPASIDFEFVDFNGTGDFELVQDIDTAAPLWNQFGTVNNALDALVQRRFRVGEVDPRTGRDRFRDVDNTVLVAREFDLQKNLIRVYETAERELPDLETVVDTRASFGNLAVTATGGAVRGDEGGPARVPVNVTVPYRQIGSREHDEQLIYEIDYVVVASKDNGEEVSRASDTLTLTFDASARESLMAERLSIQETLVVPPGNYEVLAYVRDRRRNRLGSTEFPLSVAPSGPGLTLSSVFLAQELVKGALADPGPFQFGSVRVIPATRTVFSRDDSLKLYVEAYGAGAGDDGRKRLRVDFFVMRDGRLYMGVPAAHLRPDVEPVGITSEIPLRKCEPGGYVMRVRVTDETTGAKAESEASFAVQAGNAAAAR